MRSCEVPGVTRRAQGAGGGGSCCSCGQLGAQETRGWQAKQPTGHSRPRPPALSSLACSPPRDARAPSPEPSWQGLRLTSFRGAWCRRGPGEWWRLGLALWGNPRALGSLNGLPISPGWSAFY